MNDKAKKDGPVVRETSLARPDLLDAAQAILDAGLEISAGVSGVGHFHVTATDVVEILEDKDRWLAKTFNTTEERVRGWREHWTSGGRCSAITTSGRRCLRHAPAHPGPGEFVPGESDRCRLHVDISGNR